MKTILTTMITLALFISSQLNAQSKILKLNFSDETNKWIMFPPDSKFFLTNENKEIVLSHKSGYGTFKIDKKYTLEIITTYRDDSEMYHLENGSIEIVERDSFINKKSKERNYSSHATNAEKIIFNSTINEEKKNLILKFNNGIEFSYIDGITKATLNEKNLNIQGKYYIETEIGILKISFNPKNGETWWVFDYLK
ncbi:MAG: hypothetical protein NWQ17_04610 [Polaribacter sp.]|nr:hypothetical protein [Polaribacter sp.]